jgi:hypothetical protein
MPKIIDEKTVRTRKILFWLGAIPIVLILLNSFVLDFMFSQEVMFLLMFFAFPSVAGYIALSWKLFNQSISRGGRR